MTIDRPTPPPKAAANHADPKNIGVKIWFRQSTRDLVKRLAHEHHTSESDLIERAILAYAQKEDPS